MNMDRRLLAADLFCAQDAIWRIFFFRSDANEVCMERISRYSSKKNGARN